MEQSAGDLAEAMQENCLGMRIGRLHRVVTRTFEQALAPLTLPQLEILGMLTLDRRPVRPSALAAALMLERSTVSRNLALMQRKGWLTTVGTSPTGRSMSVAIAEPGVTALTGARAAWENVQNDVANALGPAVVSTLDGWLERLTGERFPGGGG